MRLRKSTWTGAFLLGLAILPAAATESESWTGTYPLRAGGRVTLANVQGSIRVEGWDRSEVKLHIRKSTQGTRARLDEVEVNVDRRGDWLHVQTLHTGNATEPVQVDYALRVPRQARLDGLQTVNGDITVENVEGVVEARTLNGNIKQTGATGPVTAHTVNGSLLVALRALPDASAALELETINGDIQLLLPGNAQAELDMSTVAGVIESNLFSTARGLTGDDSFRTRLGRGGTRIRLRTVRGNIRVTENEDVL